MRIITILAVYFIFISLLSSQSIGSYVISSAGDDLLSEEGGLYVSIGEALNTELDEGEVMVSQGFLQVTVNGNLVSTDELLKEKIVVYPNPSSQYLVVQTEHHHSDYSYQLLNIEGQKITQGQISSEGKVQLVGIEDGMYFISFYKDGLTSETIKIIKTKY